VFKHNLELSEEADACMQTQNYVYYMHGFEGIWAKVLVHSFFVKKFDSKSMLNSLIALEHFSWPSWNKYALKNSPPKA